MTDRPTVLKAAGGVQKHSLVNHMADEYVRNDEGVCLTTNRIEGYFAILKRSITGVYHYVAQPSSQVLERVSVSILRAGDNRW
jgi:hypothetical protein